MPISQSGHWLNKCYVQNALFSFYWTVDSLQDLGLNNHFQSTSWYGCRSIILVIKRECQSICLCDMQDIEKLYNINQYANSIVILLQYFIICQDKFSSDTPQMYSMCCQIQNVVQCYTKFFPTLRGCCTNIFLNMVMFTVE